MTSFDLFIFCSFLLTLLFLGLRKKSSTESAYLLADRKTGFFALSATLVMTEFNTATLLSFSGLGYVAGFWALTLPAVFLIGLLFYAKVVAKKWKRFDGLSVAAFFSKRYGEDIGKIASITLLVAMAGFSATYVKSLSLLFAPFFPKTSEWVMSGYLTALALLLTLRGGLISIIKTDSFSAAATAIFFPLLAIFSWKQASIVTLPSLQVICEQGNALVPFWFITSLTILTMFTYILAPWYGQKIFAAKNDQTAYLSVFCASLVVFILYGLAVFSTASLRYKGASLDNPELALPYLISQALPKGLSGFGYGILFAASATTLTGVWSAMASMLIGDFFVFAPTKENKRTQVIVTAFALTSYLLSNLLVDQILQKLILANIPVAALSFALLAGFYWEKASRTGAYCSILTGLAWGIFTYLYWGDAGGYTWYWAIYGIPLTFASGIAGSLLRPNKKLIAI